MDRHEELQGQIAAYAAGRLEPADVAEIEAHLATCDECAEIAETWKPLALALRESGSALLESHPESSMLRAYAAGSLRGEAASGVARHLAGCGACALEVEAWAPERRKTLPTPVRSTFTRFGMPASLAAGLVVGLGIGLTYRPAPRIDAASPAPSRSSAGAASLIALERPTRGAVKPAVFRLESGQDFAPLLVPVVVPEAAGPADRFRFAIQDENRRTVWSAELEAAVVRKQIAASGVVAFLVPASDLMPGSKSLTFSSSTAEGLPPLLEIPFEMAR